MGINNQRAVYEKSIFRTIRYMNGSVVSKARYTNGVGFRNTGSHTRTTITPKLTPPPTHTHTHTPRCLSGWLKWIDI